MTGESRCDMINIYAEVDGYRYFCGALDNWEEAKQEAKDFKEILEDNGFPDGSVVMTDREMTNNGHITKLI